MIAKLKMTKTMDKLNDKKKKARAVMTTHSGGVMKWQYTVHTFSLERSYLSERENAYWPSCIMIPEDFHMATPVSWYVGR